MTTMHPLPFPVDPTVGASRASSAVRARFVPGPQPGSPAWTTRTGFDRIHPGIRRGDLTGAVRTHARQLRHPLPHPIPVEVGA
jgi:hypothetical protein